MKKVLTVLLAIAVMFTFSFGSAFAIEPDQVSDGHFENFWDEYVKVTASSDKVKISDTADSSNVTWDVDKSVMAKFKEDAKKVYDAYLNDVASDYVAEDAIAGTVLNGDTKKAKEFRLAVAKAQFEADMADAIADLESVPTYDYSTKVVTKAVAEDAENATGGKVKFVDKDYTYKQVADKLITYFKSQVTDKDNFTGDVYVANYKTASGEIAEMVYGENKMILPLGYNTTNGYALTGSYDLVIAYGSNTEASDGTKYFDVDSNTNLWSVSGVEAADKVEAADVAAVKAQNAANYAAYIKNNKSDADKKYADKWLKVADVLAEEGWTYASGSEEIVEPDGAAYETKATYMTELEEYATKWAAEKNADGELIRDAAKVQKALEDGIVAIAKADTNENAAIALSDAKREIDNAISEVVADRLAFLKDSIKKASEIAIADAEKDGTYYPLELEKATKLIDEYLAKIEAATKASDAQDLYVEAIEKIADIKDKAAFKDAYENNTEVEKLVDYVKSYVEFFNTSNDGDDAKYVESDNDAYDARILAKVLKMVGNDGARTNSEIKALKDKAAELAQSLPTKAEVKAAKKAAKTAVNDAPAKAKVSDLALVQAAYDALDAYRDMVTEDDTDFATFATTYTASLESLIKSYNSELAKKVTAVSKTDEAALVALADEIDAVIETLEDLEATEAQLKYLNDLADRVDGYLYGTDNNSIQAKALDAVEDAIKAIPVNVTEADKATVVKARELYDAYVAKYTDVSALRYETSTANFSEEGVEVGDWYAGYAADDVYIGTLTYAEATLGLNAEPEWAAVEALKITAKSTAKKGSITVKWTVSGDATGIDGYEIWKSTKQSKGYKKAWTTTKQTYKNSKGLKKGTRYYYKVRAYKMVDGVKYTSDWSNKAYRKAK